MGLAGIVGHRGKWSGLGQDGQKWTAEQECERAARTAWHLLDIMPGELLQRPNSEVSNPFLHLS